MIKSMTAFARQQTQGDWGSASIEIKTVNHRYLDVNTRLPEMLRDLEMPLRELVRQHLKRGKVDCSLRFNAGSQGDANITVNQGLAQQLTMAADLITAQQQLTPYTAFDVLRWPGVMQVAEADMTQTKSTLLTLATAALEELSQVRAREGAALAETIMQRLQSMEQLLIIVGQRSDEIVAEQRKKLHEKVQDMSVNVDAERLEQEIVLLAQRVDVAEELDRLATHIKETRRVLEKGGAVGRRLDFLMQEFNREANTLGSKSIDSDMTQIAVEMKVLIEQMREQVQNIE